MYFRRVKKRHFLFHMERKIKMSYYAEDYDIAVIGAGHAGCEAGLAAARLGMKTLVFSISLEAVANMPCNPHIGGSSKGHLVREIDALGGEMGKNIDKTMIQIKMLNTSKGPAVHSLRAQADRKRYHIEMKHTLEKQDNLFLKQGEIVDIKVENGRVMGIETSVGAIYGVKAVIVATGTYLKGKIFMGEFSEESGPDGVAAANKLSDSLKKIGVNLVRFKTGTPARVNRRSIDFSKMELQKGDDNIVPFSFEDEIKNCDKKIEKAISTSKSEEKVKERVQTMRKNINSNNELINEFEDNSFKCMVKEIIVGDYNKDGSVNPFALKFILNSDNIGTNTIDKENRISYMDETLITELDAKVFFEVFNVLENGYKRKDIIDKIHIKVCSDI